MKRKAEYRFSGSLVAFAVFAALLLPLVLSACQGVPPAAPPSETALPGPGGDEERSVPDKEEDRAVPAKTDAPAAEEEPRLRISHESGVYEGDSITVRIEAPEGFRVAYTTNGVTPTAADDSGESAVTVTLSTGDEPYLMSHRDLLRFPEDGTEVLESEELPRGKVLCAALIDPSGEVGAPEARVYFLGTDFAQRFPSCLVLSVYTDPKNLLDYESGILVPGAVYDAWSQTEEAQELFSQQAFWFYETNSSQKGKAWERPCLLQLYDGGETPTLEQNAGMRVRGGFSRRISQKSFNFFFRKEYGGDRMNYELFEGVGSYKSFSVNAGGNNAEWLKFKEGFLCSMAEGLDLLIPASRPAVLFINGEYWGPYLLTEKITDHMIHDRTGADRDQVVVIKDGEIEEGEDEDIALFEELASFAEKDMSDPVVYRQFCEIMDVQSMADYCALQIYIGNADWRWEKNDMLWRTRDGSYRGGRWQYIAHDLEFSSGMYWMTETSSQTDHLRLALENYPLLASALRNPEFRALFCASIRKIAFESFLADRVEEELRDWEARWRPLMPDFYLRYAAPQYQWDGALKFTSDFFRDRAAYLVPLVEAWCEGEQPEEEPPPS